MSSSKLPNYENDVCIDTDNPVGYVFKNLGSNNIVHVSGSITKDNGQKEYINQSYHVNTQIGGVIKKQPDETNPLKYDFSIGDNSGIPEDSSYQWTVDGTVFSSNSNQSSYTFDADNDFKEVHTIDVVVTPPEDTNIQPTTLSTKVSLKHPSNITYEHISGLTYKFTANNNNDDLPSSWFDHIWRVNGSYEDSGPTFTYTFPNQNEHRVTLATKINGKSLDNNSIFITPQA